MSRGRLGVGLGQPGSITPNTLKESIMNIANQGYVVHNSAAANYIATDVLLNREIRAEF